MTDNELIAEFIGATIHKELVFCGYEFRYDNSWDLLMIAVEKITKTTPMNQSWYDVKYRLIEADITNVHKAVVEFIKWYNEQT